MAAVGTIVKQYTGFYGQSGSKISKYEFTCTTWSGVISGATETFTGVTGEVVGLQIIPDTTAVPTAGYDVQILDANGFDITLACGTALQTARSDVLNRQTPKYIGNLTNEGSPVYLFKDTIAPAIQDAGHEKIVVIRLYVKQ